MGYYVRIFSTSASRVPLTRIHEALTENGLSAKIEDDGAGDDWDELTLTHRDGLAIAEIERNVVESGSLGAGELEEFEESVLEAKPKSAANWIVEYFKNVRCIYAFRLLSGTETEPGWEIFGAVSSAIRGFAPAISQADGEGFSNEDGFHILWEFDNSVKGPWNMAILMDGKWVAFEMELGDRKHRAAFKKGEVPEGAKIYATGSE